MPIKVTFKPAGGNEKAITERLFYTELEPITKKLHHELKQLWKGCIRAFITETIKNMRSDTGMSVASLMPLGRQVRHIVGVIEQASNFKIDTFNVRTSKRKNYPNAYGPYSNQNNFEWKSPEAGIALGEDAGKIDYGTPENPVFNFKFTIPVLQWYLQETGQTRNFSPPWNSIDHGETAFYKFYHDHIGEVTKVMSDSIVKYILLGSVN